MGWMFEEIGLELLFSFKIARNTSSFKTNFLVRYSDETIVGIGECAPNVRYGESVESVREQLSGFVNEGLAFDNVTGLFAFLQKSDFCYSVRNAIETAFLNYIAKSQNINIWDYLNVAAPSDAETMFTVPIMDDSDLEDFYLKYNLGRFNQIKLKIGLDSAITSTINLSKIIGNKKLFIDANEAFNNLNDYREFERATSHIDIGFVEQPFPAHQIEDYIALKETSSRMIFGDESILHNLDYDMIGRQFDGVNVKMMKTGGYIEAVRILHKAKAMGLKTMIGCMVETTVGLSNAFSISALADYLDLDSFMYINTEPYGMLREKSGKLSLA